MLLSELQTKLLWQRPVVLLNEDEEDDSVSEPDRVRPDKGSELDEPEPRPEEDLEGVEEELPLVKENEDDEGEGWEEQL